MRIHMWLQFRKHRPQVHLLLGFASGSTSVSDPPSSCHPQHLLLQGAPMAEPDGGQTIHPAPTGCRFPSCMLACGGNKLVAQVLGTSQAYDQ